MAKRNGVEMSPFCVVPRKSIKLLGESVGISYLSSEVAATVAEDASYRIRQTIQDASQFVKHSKRDHMTGEDINRALFWSHVEPIYGYGSKNSNIFSSISTKDGDLFFHEDKEINLRELAFSKGFSSLSDLGSCEINVEVSVLDKTSASNSESQSDSLPSSAELPEFDSLSPVLKSYYNQLTRSITRADVRTTKVILDDLKRNAKVQALLPYLVNFVTTAIQTLSEDVVKLLRIFSLIIALVDNKNIYLEPYVVQLVRAVMYCLVEKPVSKISTSLLDDWSLRNKAALTLCYIDRKCSNAGNFLHLQLLRTFKDIYHANDRALHCQYGALTGLAMLGVDAIEQTIFPHFKEYSEHLVNLQESDLTAGKLTGLLHVWDILRMSSMSIFRNKLKSIITTCEKQDHLQKSRGSSKTCTTGTENTFKSCLLEQNQCNKHIFEWYEQTYDIIGDALVLLLGNLEDYKNFNQSKTCLVNQSRVSMPNHSSLQYIRKLIQNALETRKRRPYVSLNFSLKSEKSRRDMDLSLSTEMNKAYLTFLEYENSECRFKSLLENSLRPRSSVNLKGHIGRLPCLHRKRTFGKSTALLSLPF